MFLLLQVQQQQSHRLVQLLHYKYRFVFFPTTVIRSRTVYNSKGSTHTTYNCHSFHYTHPNTNCITSNHKTKNIHNKSNMHIIEVAFGKNCNLYTDVLDCKISNDTNDTSKIDNATLRKAYYRSALKYHPDKNTTDDTKVAAQKFHAITAAYQILCHAELRKEYDTTGKIPSTNDDDYDDDDEFNNSDNPWKDYFDRIFGKVSVSHIEAFAMKYKCSMEEQRDVIQQYQQQKGNLLKMIQHVMLSNYCDAQRWVEDYIQPAIDTGTVSTSYTDTMKYTLQQCQKKAKKEYEKEQNKGKKKASVVEEMEEEEEHDDDEDNDEEYDDEEDYNDNDIDPDENDYDDEETEEEEEELSSSPPPVAKKSKSTINKIPSNNKTRKDLSPKKKVQPSMKNKIKAAPSSTATTKSTISKKNDSNKKKKNDNSSSNMSDLVAMIQNKNQKASNNNNNNTWSTFGARYGVNINDDDDDPIQDDAVFAKVQSKLKKTKKK